MWKLVALLPVLWLLTGAADAPSPAPPPSQTPTATPPPHPTPTPSHGAVNLSVASTPAGAKITVTGNGFFPNEPIVIFLDSAGQSLGGAVADQSGNFRQDVTIADAVA